MNNRFGMDFFLWSITENPEKDQISFDDQRHFWFPFRFYPLYSPLRLEYGASNHDTASFDQLFSDKHENNISYEN